MSHTAAIPCGTDGSRIKAESATMSKSARISIDLTSCEIPHPGTVGVEVVTGAVGKNDGAADGTTLGAPVGLRVGRLVGLRVGTAEGKLEGELEGDKVGSSVGGTVGEIEVGTTVGPSVGLAVTGPLGAVDGEIEVRSDGEADGAEVGMAETDGEFEGKLVELEALVGVSVGAELGLDDALIRTTLVGESEGKSLGTSEYGILMTSKATIDSMLSTKASNSFFALSRFASAVACMDVICWRAAKGSSEIALKNLP